MFKFLKEKLKSVISGFSKKVEEETKVEGKVEEGIEKKVEVKVEKKAEDKVGRVKESKAEKKESVKEVKKEEQKEEEKVEEKREEKKEEKREIEEKKGFFARIKEKITTTKISGEKFDELFSDLEVAMLENNVAYEVVEKIKGELKRDLVERPIKRGRVDGEIRESLRRSVEELFDVEGLDLVKMVKEKKDKPFVIVFFGVNGGGKTTSTAKVAYMLKKNYLSCVMGAADTFRAGSIAQIEDWGKRVGVKVIKHDYGSDPAAVCFDAVKYAREKKIDVVLLDTAGRQHSNVNLVEQMKKIVRVAKPDLRIFVGESITGNDAVKQARNFNDAIGLDGIILTKADVDEKGGAMVSVEYVTRKPILYLGVGQNLGDLREFSKEEVIKGLGL